MCHRDASAEEFIEDNSEFFTDVPMDRPVKKFVALPAMSDLGDYSEVSPDEVVARVMAGYKYVIVYEWEM